MPAVLKTAGPKGSVSSNLTLSAILSYTTTPAYPTNSLCSEAHRE